MIPYGYKIVNGRAEVKVDEARKLCCFFRLYSEGVAAETACAQAAIPRSPSHAWKILTNPVYAGTNFYPPIIDSDLYEEVQRQRELRRNTFETIGFKRTPIPAHTRFAMGTAEGNTAIDLFNAIQCV